jgi:hypothetical protein
MSDVKSLADRHSDGTRAAKRKTAGAIDAVVERVEEVFSRDEQADRND